MRTRSIFVIMALVAVLVMAGAYNVSACQKGTPPTGKHAHMQSLSGHCAGKVACDPAMCAQKGCDPAKCAQKACDPAMCAKMGCDPSKCTGAQAGQKCAPGACKGAAACPKTQAGAQQGTGCTKH
jgi:hypothetical protein